MITSRRSFLGAMLAASAGPAIVRVASLMPVKPLTIIGIPEFEFWHSSFTEIVTTTLRSHRNEMLRNLTDQNIFFRRLSKPRLDIYGSPIHSSEI